MKACVHISGGSRLQEFQPGKDGVKEIFRTMGKKMMYTRDY